MLKPADAAKQIVEKAYASETISAIVANSPEPIRCMIYETYIINATELDGTPYFAELMDEIEAIY